MGVDVDHRSAVLLLAIGGAYYFARACAVYLNLKGGVALDAAAVRIAGSEASVLDDTDLQAEADQTVSGVAVIGGILPVSGQGSDGALGAADIDSASGAGVSAGDIPRTETHVAMARTLGVGLGISSDALANDFVASAGGKVVNAALNGVTG